jgi:hypothetical protein
MNATVRSTLVDLASSRTQPDEADAVLFPLSYRQTQVLFAQAVGRAATALRARGQDAGRLDGVTWHALRHTFASRLVMAWTSGRPRSSGVAGHWRWSSAYPIPVRRVAEEGLPGNVSSGRVAFVIVRRYN